VSDINFSPWVSNHLARCRSVARENLIYYETIFESIKEGPDKDMIGRALAQKQDFISAVDVVLNAYEVDESQTQVTWAANDHSYSEIINCEDLRLLKQEELFKDTLSQCLNHMDNEGLRELLSHHLEASELAVSAIKSTSLKL